ncbi:MAG: 50S ribosomal protein L1 [bacterium]|nr:50S ribosomal protein L1 [bacterium]
MSKRLTEATKGLEKGKLYSIEEAVAMTKNAATAKFDETIELHFNVNIDPKQGDQQIRGTVVLPHGSGKTVRVAAFVDSTNETAAKEAGADIIGTEETIDQIVKTGKIDFDVAVAVPSMMAKLAKAARVLGPRGLMPNPKTDTVGPNVEKMVKEQKGGKVAFKNDNTCNVHVIAGKASFDLEKLTENVQTVVDAIKRSRPNGVKGTFMKSATMTSTMGPAVAIDTTQF